MKLCKDCRHIQWGEDKRAWAAHCLHPTSLYTPPRSPVTGEGIAAYQLSCEQARDGIHTNACGPNGQHWEPADAKPA